MSLLLSRAAERLYWAARYLERAEDTARLVRAYTEVIVDLPTTVTTSWAPLLAVVGGEQAFSAAHGRSDAGERRVIQFLLAEDSNPGSVAHCVRFARDNLRTTREVLPREAWQVVNDLFLYVSAEAGAGAARSARSRFCDRVVGEVQHLDGILSSTWSRDEAYELWRLGEALERADMTTRVLGVRAASLLAARSGAEHGDHAEVQWMGVLRSLSALQMYQRATRAPIESAEVVRFLLSHRAFPRSVAYCVARLRASLGALPHVERTLPALEELEALVAAVADAGRGDADGVALDADMDRIQLRLHALDATVADAFFAVGAAGPR
ncbi:MAG: alpha-E domain-containing protein [Acidimicrobiales bacterium]